MKKNIPQNFYVGEEMNLERLYEKKKSIEHKIFVKKELINKKEVSIKKGYEYLRNKYEIKNIDNNTISDYRDWYAYPDIASVFYTICSNEETINKLKSSISEYNSDLESVDRIINNVNSIANFEQEMPEVLVQLKNFLCNNDFCIDNEEDVIYTIVDFYFKVEDAVGGNSNWDDTCCVDANVSGIVKGNSSSVVVNSVLAGGHGVQKSHLRTVIRPNKEEQYEEE